MKKFKLTLLISAMVFSGALIYLTSCQKQQENQIQNNPVDEQSREVTQHILDFKARMEYYRQNPNLKSGGETYTADSAALELESLLNFDFCYTDIECNKKTFETSEVILPLDILERINDPNLMQVYYDKVIDTIQAQMGRINYANMKLLLVDLEVSGYDSNGDAIISVGSLIGNEENVVLHNDNWWYGKNMGLCGGGQTPEDAATQLDARVTNNMISSPPVGCTWHFTYIVPEYIVPTIDPLDPTPDNYLDYEIFYATTVGGLIINDNVECLSQYEMNFYEGHYIDYAHDKEINLGKKFSHCIIIGDEFSNDPLIIQHFYTVFLGNRFLKCGIAVEDILTQ